jgi:hypothetical protein
VGWPLPAELEDEERLEAAVLGAAKAPEEGGREKPDVKWIHAELAANPEGYQYSQFCEIYRRYRRRLAPTMRQVHRAGEKAFVDFSGKKPPPCRLRRDAGVGPGSQEAQGETGTAAGARCGARSWGARKAEAPRWSRMRRMMRPSVMNATTRITPWQRGQTSGSVSYTRRSN